MVIQKETLRLRYYELREQIESHDDAICALAAETAQDEETVRVVMGEEVGA